MAIKLKKIGPSPRIVLHPLSFSAPIGCCLGLCQLDVCPSLFWLNYPWSNHAVSCSCLYLLLPFRYLSLCNWWIDHTHERHKNVRSVAYTQQQIGLCSGNNAPWSGAHWGRTWWPRWWTLELRPAAASGGGLQRSGWWKADHLLTADHISTHLVFSCLWISVGCITSRCSFGHA